MNPQEPNDDIEARLQAMRPADPSPAVRKRIASSIDEIPATANLPWPIHRRVLIRLTVAAAVTLAGVIVVLVLFSPAEPQIVISEPPPVLDETQLPEPMPPTAIEPTLFELNNMLRASPEAVSAALDRISTERFALISSDSRSTPPAVPVWIQLNTED